MLVVTFRRNKNGGRFKYTKVYGEDKCLCPRGGGGWGGHLTIREGAAPSFNPLPFYIPFWQKRYPFYVPFIEKRYPFHIPTLEHCTPFLRFCNTLTNNTMGEYQALPEEMLSKRQPFIYLEPEKSTYQF